MKSKKLRKLVASVAMLALSVTIMNGGIGANAAPPFSNEIQYGWTLNQRVNVQTIKDTNVTTILNGATKTNETIFSVEKIETGVAPSTVTVDGTELSGDSGVARIGIRLNGNLASTVNSYLNNAVAEYRDNVNTVNSNRHNNGQNIKTSAQEVLGKELYKLFTNVKEGASDKNRDVRFLLTYELSDGRSRTTTILLSDLKLEMPVTTGVSSVSDLHSLVDENGLVYLTLRGLPTGVTITNMELDSRSNIFAATNTAGSAYSEQSSLSYNAGRVSIPTSTWILTGSLYPSVSVNGQVFKQFDDPSNTGIIDPNEHLFVRVGGNTITLVDLIRDPDNTITGITVTDRRGDTYKAEVGNFVSADSFGTRYKDVKISGLTTRTNYEFSYMDITYKLGNEERTQRVSFNNSAVTGGVTGADYLRVTTGDVASAQLSTFRSLLGTDPTVLYQVNVGNTSLQYIVKVDDTSNLSRIEVRGLRGNETYKVENVKSEDGKQDKSNWYAVTIENLERGRNYDFLSLETVYTENGRERYGTPISLGRRSTTLDNVLFPGNRSNSENIFTTTNNSGNLSEIWVDANLKAEQVPGGIKFVARVKDADNILDKVRVYVSDNGSYREVDSSNVKLEKTYRVVKGVDVNGNNSISGSATIDYRYPSNDQNADSKIQFVNESNIESASKMVEVTVTGIPSNSDREFRLEFGTTQDGNRVSSLLGTNEGAFGSIPTSGTKTQQAVTRYTKGRAGSTKVEVNTSTPKVSNITTTTANVEVSIKNPDKEGIAVDVLGAAGVTGKYNIDKNIIELSGLRPGTEYKDLRLTLRYGDRNVTINVPTFKTTTTSETTTGVAGYVSRVYTTFFNREPDQGGLLYWTERLVGGQETLRGFLGQLAYTPELIEKGLTNQQFVERMYAIVDRKGEAEGINFWVGEIQKALREGKTQSEARGSVVERMLETPEVRAIAQKLGIKY